MEVLKRIYDEFCLPLDLYDRVKKSLTYMFITDMDELNEFMDVLPSEFVNRISTGRLIIAGTQVNISSC